MRTSMNLPDPLLQQVKQFAAASDRTVTSVVEQALRELLERPQQQRRRIELPTDGEPDNHALVDLEDKDAVWAAIDGNAPLIGLR